MADQDRRSPEALEYRRLYKTARWRRTREDQLARQPLCEMCCKAGRVVEATVCHHADKGSKAERFFDGPFMSLCGPCHDGPVQAEERGSIRQEVGVDGWPL